MVEATSKNLDFTAEYTVGLYAIATEEEARKLHKRIKKHSGKRNKAMRSSIARGKSSNDGKTDDYCAYAYWNVAYTSLDAIPDPGLRAHLKGKLDGVKKKAGGGGGAQRSARAFGKYCEEVGSSRANFLKAVANAKDGDLISFAYPNSGGWHGHAVRVYVNDKGEKDLLLLMVSV